MERSQYGEVTEGADRDIGFYLADNFSYAAVCIGG